MRVDSDDDFDDYDMLESDDDTNHQIDDTPASTPPSASTPHSRPGSRQKKLSCPYEGCDKAYSRQARLTEHIRSHTQERPFVCPHPPCTKAFLRDSHLKHHVKVAHTDIRDYKCTWDGCDASFATGTRLRRHVEAHKAKEKFTCRGYPGCSQVFRKQETLDRHILSVHEQVKPFQCPDNDPITGLPCNKSYDTAEHLRGHQRTRHDTTRFSCSDCMALNAASLANSNDVDPDSLLVASFATYGELQAHITIVHPPTCSYCPTSFTTNKELTRHLEIQHGILPDKPNGTGKEFPCTYDGCNKIFTKKGNLNVHIKTVHENKRDFVCGETTITLPEELADKEDVVVHGCGRNFTSKATLEEHVRTAHLGLEAKRVVRNKKRKAERQVNETDEQAFKKRKPRSDKGTKKSSAIAGLTGQTPAQNSETEQPQADGQGLGAFSFHPPAAVDVPANQMDEDDDDNFLSGSMVMCGSQIFHYGSSYHYPSGEYPTVGGQDPAGPGKNDEETASHGGDLEYGQYLPDGAMDYEVDDNFFGGFETEPAFANYPAPSSYY
ncbi:general transcription factor IIIA [Exophiala viscosa]|uniref:general transcription factor IIIA n=1 Tax=Exophiala viscosa TaxID=2486360 RepID=UPI0021909A8D|nr:general transcription factor IIIA [Exophiala viscosa]